MNTYNIPRNVKGEGRILFIFSSKALIYATIGGGIGVVFYFILNMIGLGTLGIIIIAVLGLIGFVIATFPMPEISGFKFTKTVSGENIDDIIKRAVKFKQNKKIYVYTKEKGVK